VPAAADGLASALLSARGVARRYGRRVALAPTTVEIHPGDSLALVGPNGAGKSTLLSILAGALEPSEGSVTAPDGAAAPRIGWMPQKPAEYVRLSPRENLELFARLERLDDAVAAAERFLRLLELPDDERLVAQLSAGNQQRLNLAIALLPGPEVLLVDEPTAALDPRRRRRFWEVAAEVPKRGGALVFVTQHLEEVEHHATRVLVLRDGSAVFAGTREEYARAPEADVFE
jgi:ABC-2 type transport system ATP-binding protein